jgi:hypothetical protein
MTGITMTRLAGIFIRIMERAPRPAAVCLDLGDIGSAPGCVGALIGSRTHYGSGPRTAPSRQQDISSREVGNDTGVGDSQPVPIYARNNGAYKLRMGASNKDAL